MGKKEEFENNTFYFFHFTLLKLYLEYSYNESKIWK